MSTGAVEEKLKITGTLHCQNLPFHVVLVCTSQLSTFGVKAGRRTNKGDSTTANER
jgi:hypothetical protein